MRKCSHCHVTKIDVDFYRNSSTRDGLSFCCTDCICKQRENPSLKTFFRDLYLAAKCSAKHRRLKKGRPVAGVIKITQDDLMGLWDRQQGLCYYSKLPMTPRPKSEWQCSLERLDPSLGYILSNVVLCCLEFNGNGCQWSLDKVNKLLCPSLQPASPITQGLFDKRTRTCYKIAEPDKVAPRFTPRGHLYGLLGNARKHTLLRKKRKREMAFDIDFDWMIEQYIRQQGMCYYSGMCMNVGKGDSADWKVSLERLDASVGYLKTNTVMICHEFNMSVNWSRDKVELVRASARRQQHVNV